MEVSTGVEFVLTRAGIVITSIIAAFCTLVATSGAIAEVVNFFKGNSTVGVATVDEVLLLAVSSEFGHVRTEKDKSRCCLTNVNGEIRQVLVRRVAQIRFRT